ncbi:MAG: hypothetical protein HYS13_07090 [Planctomycetia bacterium]|nr:hypothetical protein [Planctomycetia bacterium]
MPLLTSLLVSVACGLTFACASPAEAELPEVGQSRTESETLPFEQLREDTGWCAPRVLYFLACYAGRECSLDEVVKLCKCDDKGTARMSSLVDAAEALGLEPTAIECTADQIVGLSGPAILCIDPRRRFDAKPPGGDLGVLHFIGYVRPDGDYLRIIDPAVSGTTILARRESIRKMFTGKAILLKGCDRPFLLPSWYTPTSAAVVAGAVGVALGAYVLVRRRKAARRTIGARA